MEVKVVERTLDYGEIWHKGVMVGTYARVDEGLYLVSVDVYSDCNVECSECIELSENKLCYVDVTQLMKIPNVVKGELVIHVLGSTSKAISIRVLRKFEGGDEKGFIAETYLEACRAVEEVLSRVCRR